MSNWLRKITNKYIFHSLNQLQGLVLCMLHLYSKHDSHLPSSWSITRLSLFYFSLSTFFVRYLLTILQFNANLKQERYRTIHNMFIENYRWTILLSLKNDIHVSNWFFRSMQVFFTLASLSSWLPWFYYEFPILVYFFSCWR